MAIRPDKHHGGRRVHPPPASEDGQAASARSAAAAVQVVSISKSYGHRRHRVDALQDVSASFARGTLTAVMGLSGCGKSTLLQCAAGLDKPTATALLRDLLAATRGRSVLLITHHEEDVAGCDRTVTIDAGHELADG